jgi:hypothetical protein
MSFNDILNPTYLQKLTSNSMNNAIILTFVEYVPPEGFPDNNWDNRAYYSTYTNTNDLSNIILTKNNIYDIFSSSFFDPFILMIYDNNGMPIAANSEKNDYTYGNDNIFDFIAPYTGEYYIDASWDRGQYYDYASLSIYETIPEEPNSIPTSKNINFNIDADDSYIFKKSDFYFYDSDINDTLESIKIFNLSNIGVLFFNGQIINNQIEISIEDLNDNNLIFYSNEELTNFNFDFKVSDGEDYSSNFYNFNFSINQIKEENDFVNTYGEISRNEKITILYMGINGYKSIENYNELTTYINLTDKLTLETISSSIMSYSPLKTAYEKLDISEFLELQFSTIFGYTSEEIDAIKKTEEGFLGFKYWENELINNSSMININTLAIALLNGATVAEKNGNGSDITKSYNYHINTIKELQAQNISAKLNNTMHIDMLDKDNLSKESFIDFKFDAQEFNKDNATILDYSFDNFNIA